MDNSNDKKTKRPRIGESRPAADDMPTEQRNSYTTTDSTSDQTVPTIIRGHLATVPASRAAISHATIRAAISHVTTTRAATASRAAISPATIRVATTTDITPPRVRHRPTPRARQARTTPNSPTPATVRAISRAAISRVTRAISPDSRAATVSSRAAISPVSRVATVSSKAAISLVSRAATVSSRAAIRPEPSRGYQGRQQGGYRQQQGGYQNQRPQRQNQFGMPRGGKSFVPRPKRVEYEMPLPDPDEQIRLNKFMANAGICSRREADEFIQQGLVKVNGNVVTELGTKITHSDTVEYDGKVVTLEHKCYILLNKPKDCVTTSDDPNGRLTVMDIVKGACEERIYPVGRLDRNTTRRAVVSPTTAISPRSSPIRNM